MDRRGPQTGAQEPFLSQGRSETPFLLQGLGGDHPLVRGLRRRRKEGGKLRYYYISALYHTGKAKEALELLEENGGLEIPDIREGEDSIAQLYLDIQKTLTGKDVPLPFKYDFRAGF